MSAKIFNFMSSVAYLVTICPSFYVTYLKNYNRKSNEVNGVGETFFIKITTGIIGYQ